MRRNYRLLIPRYKFALESVKVFQDPAELYDQKRRLSDFRFETALQLQSRLPENIRILRKISSMDPRNVLAEGSSRDVSEIAAHYESLNIDVSMVESELRRLGHTTLTATPFSPWLTFWAEVANLKSGNVPLFPNLTRLVSILACFPSSNATVERMFSEMGAAKTKARNRITVEMVESVLHIRHNIRRRGESCSSFAILPPMLERFNQSMYDHKRLPQAQPNTQERDNAVAEEEDEEFIEVLHDVEEIFGQPVFITH